MELTSKLTLEMSGELFLLEKRIELLHAIAENGSISKAAKAVPMSYKSAWEAVDVMNTLSPEPIVYRETGGKDGGGTTVTTYGKRLLENYAVLKREHTHFLERLTELTDIESGTFKTIGRLGLQISARNQMQATVIAVKSGEVEARVQLVLKGGHTLFSEITKEAVKDLHIAVGQSVTAICKSSNISILTGKNRQKENQIEGQILQIEKDSHNAKVTVDIGMHDRIVSVLPIGEFSKLNVEKGSRVMVGIEAKNIMVGR